MTTHVREVKWRILDGLTFFWSNLYCLSEKTENKQKEAGVGPFLNVTINHVKPIQRWAQVLAQLGQWLLIKPDNLGSVPIEGNNYFLVSIEKTN